MGVYCMYMCVRTTGEGPGSRVPGRSEVCVRHRTLALRVTGRRPQDRPFPVRVDTVGVTHVSTLFNIDTRVCTRTGHWSPVGSYGHTDEDVHVYRHRSPWAQTCTSVYRNRHENESTTLHPGSAPSNTPGDPDTDEVMVAVSRRLSGTPKTPRRRRPETRPTGSWVRVSGAGVRPGLEPSGRSARESG